MFEIRNMRPNEALEVRKVSSKVFAFTESMLIGPVVIAILLIIPLIR